MRGKKGFIRILEAFIAILIISGAMAFFYVSQVQKPNQEEAIRDLERLILEDISNDLELRKAVLTEDIGVIDLRIDEFVSNDYGYDFKICPINEICGFEGIADKEIFSDEVAISSTLTIYEPKVLKLFIWEK